MHSRWLSGKQSACQCRRLQFNLWFERKGNGNPLQYPGLENLMDREAWWVTVHWVTKSPDTTEQLHFHLSN